MTLSNATNSVSYTAAGTAAEVFDIPFPFTANSEIILLEAGTLQVQGTIYTVTGAGSDTGGTATYVGTPAASATILITRVVPLTQSTNLLETGRFSAEAVEDALDRQVMIAQQGLQLDTTNGDTFDAQTRRIANVVDPTADQDAATKVWVTGQITGAGDLPVPADPGDDGKGLLASGGAFVTSTMELVPVPGAGDLNKPLVANTAASGGYAYETTPAHGGRAQNLLLNGAFQIAQHGTSFTAATTPVNSNDTYLLDQWILLSDGNDAVDVSQETTIVPDGALNSCKLLVTATNNKKFGLLQILEAEDTARAVEAGNGKVSLSFEARTTTGAALSNLRVGVIGWTGTADSVTSNPVTAWNAAGANPTLDATSWDDVGTSGYLNTPANLALVVDAWTTFTETNISMDASITNLALFIWSDDDGTTANDVVYISNVQLVIGDRVDTYGFRRHSEELRMCQRYLQVFSAGAADEFFGSAHPQTTAIAECFIQFLVPMRIAPTAVAVATASTDFQIADRAASEPVNTSLVFTNATTFGAKLTATQADVWLAGDSIMLESANANAKLTFSAEL